MRRTLMVAAALMMMCGSALPQDEGGDGSDGDDAGVSTTAADATPPAAPATGPSEADCAANPGLPGCDPFQDAQNAAKQMPVPAANIVSESFRPTR